MNLIVKVSPELAARLETEARRNGVSEDEFVRLMLEEKLNPKKEKRPSPFSAKIIAADLPVRDRSREYAWLEQHRDEHDGKYVALDGDKLLAVGDNAMEVATSARKIGVKGALIVYVEGSNRPRFISGGVS